MKKLTKTILLLTAGYAVGSVMNKLPKKKLDVPDNKFNFDEAVKNIEVEIDIDRLTATQSNYATRDELSEMKDKLNRIDEKVKILENDHE